MIDGFYWIERICKGDERSSVSGGFAGLSQMTSDPLSISPWPSDAFIYVGYWGT